MGWSYKILRLGIERGEGSNPGFKKLRKIILAKTIILAFTYESKNLLFLSSGVHIRAYGFRIFKRKIKMRLVKSFSPSYYSDEVKYERLKLIVFIYNQILKVNVDT